MQRESRGQRTGKPGIWVMVDFNCQLKSVLKEWLSDMSENGGGQWADTTVDDCASDKQLKAKTG